MASQFDAPPVLGVRGTLGFEIGSNRNIGPTFLFDFYAHHMPILHRLARVHNATDILIGVGRLVAYAVALAA